MENFRALKEQYGDRNLALGHRTPKKRSQGEDGSRKNLASARRWMTRCAGTARHMGCGNKGQAVEQRQRMREEGSNRIRAQDFKEQLCLRKERAFGRILVKTVELEVTKRIVGTSIRLWEVNVKIFWKLKKKLHTE